VLLDQGATVTAKNDRGETPLLVTSRCAYESQDGARLVRLLLEHGADVNATDKGNATSLHFACGNGKLDIVRELLNHGAVTNAKNKLGETPLHVVPTDGVRVARLLLEHGVDVNIPDKDGRTALGAVSFRGSPEIARVFLDHGAPVNARDDFGWTPLHLLSQYYYQESTEGRGLDVARLLLERGADIRARDINHMTPLDLVSRRRREWRNMVQIFLEHGAIFFIYMCES
jgi:ankyrin repeat protein